MTNKHPSKVIFQNFLSDRKLFTGCCQSYMWQGRPTNASCPFRLSLWLTSPMIGRSIVPLRNTEPRVNMYFVGPQQMRAGGKASRSSTLSSNLHLTVEAVRTTTELLLAVSGKRLASVIHAGQAPCPAYRLNLRAGGLSDRQMNASRNTGNPGAWSWV
jgi:hypothetical protein